MEDFQEAPGVPAVQRVLGGLLGLPGRRHRDHLYRPLLPRDLEALRARQAPETNRSRPS